MNSKVRVARGFGDFLLLALLSLVAPLFGYVFIAYGSARFLCRGHAP